MGKVSKSLFYQIALCALTLSILTLIELYHPYYFLQDDNRDQTLPYFIHNFRALLQGEFPLFNFHQFLGMPALATLQPAAFYPINYIAVILSKLILGHYFGTMEFIAAIHLIMAALGFYHFTRHFRLNEESCFFGALAWAFCGIVIVCGNSWMFFPEHAAYFPWLLLLSFKQIDNPKAITFSLLVIVKGLIFFIGYPQMFLYCVTFEFAATVLYYIVTNQKPPSSNNLPERFDRCTLNIADFMKFIGYYLLNSLCVVIIIAPVLLPGIYQMSMSADRNARLSWDEYSILSYDLLAWINGLIIPFSSKGVAESFVPVHFISHIGYLPLLFLCLAILKSITGKKSKYVILFLVLAVFSFLWASNTVITKLFYLLPIYNRMRWPFKVIFFTSYFLVTIATFGFDMFYHRIKSVKHHANALPTVAFIILTGILVFNYIILYAGLPQQSLARHLDKVPFDEPLKDVLANGRIVSIGFNFYNDDIENGKLYGYTAPSLGYNYATLWGLYHFGGYERLISTQNSNASLGLNYHSIIPVEPGFPLDMPSYLPLFYFREWGVKYYIIDKNVYLRDIGGLVLFYSDQYRNIVYDPRAKPFIYWEDNPNEGNISYKFGTNTIEIGAERAADGNMHLNFLFNSFFNAYIDGEKVGLIETADAQMSLFVSKGVHSIKIEYVDPYFKYGLMLVITFIAAGSVTLFVLKQKVKRVHICK